MTLTTASGMQIEIVLPKQAFIVISHLFSARSYSLTWPIEWPQKVTERPVTSTSLLTIAGCLRRETKLEDCSQILKGFPMESNGLLTMFVHLKFTLIYFYSICLNFKITTNNILDDIKIIDLNI